MAIASAVLATQAEVAYEVPCWLVIVRQGMGAEITVQPVEQLALVQSEATGVPDVQFTNA